MLTKSANGSILYAIAYEYIFKSNQTGKRKIVTDFEYLHAENEGHARGQFWLANEQKRRYGRLRIVSAAPAVGWYAQDDNGDVAVA